MNPSQDGRQQEGQQPVDRGDESFSRLVSPLLAGFSLPTMVGLVAGQTPGQPWRDLSLSCLIAASGLFLASYQLSIGSLYERYRDSLGDLRAGLSFAGILLLIAALIVFVGAAAAHWWASAALAVHRTPNPESSSSAPHDAGPLEFRTLRPQAAACAAHRGSRGRAPA